MAELKTTRNEGDVDVFLDSVDNETRRRDAFAMKDLMADITGEKPEMLSNATVGYGPTPTPRNQEGPSTNGSRWAFPQETEPDLVHHGRLGGYEDLLGRLGSHTTGKACLYIKDLEKVDKEVLSESITGSVAHVGELQEG